MGFSGHATKVIKVNRALLKKRRTFKEVKEMFFESSDSTELKFKEVSPEKLARIKADIRRRAKIDAWKEAGIYIACTLAVFYGLYWLFYM